jgi:hypothetical protein
MVAWNDGGNATLTFYRNQGSSFAPGVAWAVRDGGWSNNMRWSAGNYDADGFDDVFTAWNDAGMHTLTVRRSTGRGFATSHWSTRTNGWQESTAWCTGVFDGT